MGDVKSGNRDKRKFSFGFVGRRKKRKGDRMKTITCDCGFICLDVEHFLYCPKCGAKL